MIKRAIAFLILAFTLTPVLAQIPAGYYSTADGKTGAELKTALYLIIKDHDALTYSDLWTAFQTTDKKSNGKVWDMYSDNPGGTPPYEYTFITDQCGNYSGENSCYNREHSFPKSWFNDGYPMYTDLFHLYPTDGYVNGKRSNYPFGEVGSATWTSMNGSKLGSSSYPGYSGTVFEPIDEYKGDFARSYFYMVTRYENVVMNWSSAMLDGSKYPAFTTWSKNMLLEWHRQDPVSQKEIDRNNAIYNNFQHNRNPFIDHPEYAECIWASCSTDQPVSFTSSPITGANVGVSYSYSVTTTGGTVGSTRTVSCTEKPTWLTFSSTGNGAATLSGTPGAANLGTASVKLLVTDGTTSANQNFTITVSEVSANLTFTSSAVTSATAERVYTYSITATDSNNPSASVSISCSQKPAWLSFTSTGNGTATLTGTPASTDVGTHNVTLVATSGSASTNQSFVVTVSEASASNIETFTNIPASSSSYSSRSWTGDDGSTWTATNARTDQTINEAAICIKDVAGSYVQSGTLSGGVTSIQFKHKQAFSGGGGELTLYINGTQRGEPVAVTDVEGLAQIAVSGVSGSFVIKLESNGASRIIIDDVEWVSGSTSTNSLPSISNISYLPASPIPTEDISVSATITDSDGTIAAAVLLWGVAESNITNEVPMTANGNIYSAAIPALNTEGTIYYRISATDNDGGLTQSAVSSISVVAPANELPVISEVSSTPSSPTITDAITITAAIADADGTIDAAYIMWGFAGEAMDSRVDLALVQTTYTAQIPATNRVGILEYRVYAVDDDGGVAQSSVHSITISGSDAENQIPVISAISNSPQNPTSNDNIVVSATITDSDGTIVSAYVDWGLTQDNLANRLSLTSSESVYSATIPALTTGGTVYYRLSAQDNDGGLVVTTVGSVVVSLVNTKPVLGNIEVSPETIEVNQSITITAEVTDAEDNITSVRIHWGTTASSLVNSVDMSLSEGKYQGTIPGIAEAGKYYFRVKASDVGPDITSSSALYFEVMPANTAPVISDVSFTPSAPKVNQPVAVSAVVVDNESNLNLVQLYWGTSSAAMVNAVNMSAGEGNSYSGSIPSQSEAATIHFYVKATDLRGEIATSQAQQFEVSVGSGIDDVERALDVKVYPNPAADKVVVETPASVIVSSVELFNLVGIRLSNLNIDAQQSVTTLSLSGVKSGVYIIRVVTDRGTVSKRLVVR